MEDSLFWGIPKSAYESADRMLILARKGGIRQHLLGDTSRIRHGTIEDQSVDEYCNFLQTKLCCEILQLREQTCLLRTRQHRMDWLQSRERKQRLPPAAGRNRKGEMPDGQRNEFYRKHVFEL